MPAIVRSLCSTSHAEVVDLSRSDVRLRCAELRRGEQVELRIDVLSAFGTVLWSSDGECGIDFDVPLADFDVAGLR